MTAPTELLRPIIGIENRTAQEVFDIMCDRFCALPTSEADWRDMEQKAVGRGMAIAAGIVMSCWGDETAASEILGAAGYRNVEAMRADGVDEYDINLCAPALPSAPDRRAGE